jgi:hypothetical protein
MRIERMSWIEGFGAFEAAAGMARARTRNADARKQGARDEERRMRDEG